MWRSRIGIFTNLCLVAVLAACSNVKDETADSTDNPILPGSSGSATNVGFRFYLGDGGEDSVTRNIQSRSSWQSMGVKVKPGQYLQFVSSGTWTGGQKQVGATSSSSDTMWCGAAGCVGDTLLGMDDPLYVYGDIFEDLVYAPSVYDSDGYTRMHQVIYSSSNILRFGEGGFDQKAGIFNGDLDGMTVCYSANNVFLGAEVAGIEHGYWASRRNAWQSAIDRYSLSSGGQMHPSMPYWKRLRDIYAAATCSNPPEISSADPSKDTFEKIHDDNIAASRNFLLRETEYEPVYHVTIPSNNYKDRCNSEGDIILSYSYGLPHQIIEKNECVKSGLKNELACKIVSDGERPKDVAGFIVGDNYQASAYTVSKDGEVFCRNNDGDGGLADNEGSLNVTMRLVSVSQ